MPAPYTRPAAGSATRKPALRQPSRRIATTTAEKTQSPAAALKPTNTNITRLQRSPSVQSVAGAKRKEREYEPKGNEDTNIHVVVRCRGRSDREIQENSAVVVSAEGSNGVELSMGPNALSNKAYHFDKVFSPAADQTTLFDDVVTPILNEMLSGYNCTIFAYGQTGTGKTYTMSGDMTDTLGILSENAGIIPRVLYSLFNKLEDRESTVKCSFIELYNEELRDLLSLDDKSNLKIYDNESKRGHNSSTLVQGMEEHFIHSATDGIKLLRGGSYKRQVAATKCNDLSSRSHTIFTVTTNVKRTTEAGEEYISTGKLNLVDLAGSENIQRSGADNKRAAEAGLINKSLLTLGRVINALVDKSSHIPYRESKLTRLLQDSLGGQTKTCIIATISPARSNLEETISTLDYAFRAKNIRNKPQINSTLPKKTLLREYTMEIEQLKSDLIATRHRNGVYLSAEAYEEMKIESESRRIINEEQRAKIESKEASLKHKTEELFALTSNFNNLKKDNEETRAALNQTNDVLEQTEIVLRDTKKQLEQEEKIRQAHQETEEKLHHIGSELLHKLDQTVEHVNGLHMKLRRKSDLHNLNRDTWESSTGDVVDVTKLIEDRVEIFKSEHSDLIQGLSAKITDFITAELQAVASGQSQINVSRSLLNETAKEMAEQSTKAHDEMNGVLEEIKVLREVVKGKVGQGLNGLSAAAERISKEVIDEMTDFHTQLHSSYSTLGRDFKAMFESITGHMELQKKEINELQTQLLEANRQAIEGNRSASAELAKVLEEERQAAESDRVELLSQIGLLIETSGQKQASRLKGRVEAVTFDLESSGDNLQKATDRYQEGMNEWTGKEDQLMESVISSRDTIKGRMQEDWEVFEQRNESIQKSTEAVHQETVRIVDEQVQQMAVQMEALDDFVTRARSQNGSHHESHLANLESLARGIKISFVSLEEGLGSMNTQLHTFQEAATNQEDSIRRTVAPFSEELRQPLVELRNNIRNAPMTDYKPTGTTPPRTSYEYPRTLPRTESCSSLLDKIKQATQPVLTPLEEENLDPGLRPPSKHRMGSPVKTRVYNDAEDEGGRLKRRRETTQL
ncbi:kinesin family protein (BimC), putative [Talaromyces stipitatus ATCC 10500]|uniref:Kinesin family protein (BimC), putative n=1 Tax=Talaromyces stipitatus (strain ATCC 10500 / CBS 375.48 / QM 6759 / NRRL 1006) TaxID=441959 RepID=B8M4A9_TALSN|nr:kinesin family protein (BimC), putative [Talaromyces stipitatus ATCC 10500]EED19104.1 kinesin family protein (BimC), putative [Talaromyces stipitatus ATCC 10500]